MLFGPSTVCFPLGSEVVSWYADQFLGFRTSRKPKTGNTIGALNY